MYFIDDERSYFWEGFLYFLQHLWVPRKCPWVFQSLLGYLYHLGSLWYTGVH